MKILLNNPLMYVYVNPNKFFFTIQLLFLWIKSVSLNYGFPPGSHWGYLQRASKPPSCSGVGSEMLNHPLRESRILARTLLRGAFFSESSWLSVCLTDWLSVCTHKEGLVGGEVKGNSEFLKIYYPYPCFWDSAYFV